MTQAVSTRQTATFNLKGGMYTLTALQLLSIDLSTLKLELAERINQAPKFFINAPVVIDLVKINSIPSPIDFTGLRHLLMDLRLIPVGIRGGSPSQNEGAIEAGLPVLPEAKSQPTIPSEQLDKKSKAEPTDEVDKPASTLLIAAPVRSGQQVFAKNGDLIVHGTVSVGAEILADGHIHVYGALRGRALAGVHGNRNARIYCHELDAELLSIAGQYGMRDDLITQGWGKAVGVQLNNDKLSIEVL